MFTVCGKHILACNELKRVVIKSLSICISQSGKKSTLLGWIHISIHIYLYAFYPTPSYRIPHKKTCFSLWITHIANVSAYSSYICTTVWGQPAQWHCRFSAPHKHASVRQPGGTEKRPHPVPAVQQMLVMILQFKAGHCSPSNFLK